MSNLLVYDIENDFYNQSDEVKSFLIEKSKDAQWDFEHGKVNKRPSVRSLRIDGIRWENGSISGFGLTFTHSIQYKNAIDHKKMFTVDYEKLYVEI